jgi:viroplasmin and RNaseH domain-containing protein
LLSDRGDAHPRVTGCPSVHKSFFAIQDARAYMNRNRVTEPKEVIKDGAGETTPLRDSQAFYAVAHGKQPGIYPYW